MLWLGLSKWSEQAFSHRFYRRSETTTGFVRRSSARPAALYSYAQRCSVGSRCRAQSVSPHLHSIGTIGSRARHTAQRARAGGSAVAGDGGGMIRLCRKCSAFYGYDTCKKDSATHFE